MSELRICASTERLEEVQNFIKDIIKPYVKDEKMMFELEVVVEEIFVNIAHYAYAPEMGEVIVRCVICNEMGTCVRIVFEDEGRAFNPLKKEEADITLSVEERQIGGLGIFMVKKMMDKVEYIYENGKNCLTLWKKLRI